jgi:hypothetical protein
LLRPVRQMLTYKNEEWLYDKVHRDNVVYVLDIDLQHCVGLNKYWKRFRFEEPVLASKLEARLLKRAVDVGTCLYLVSKETNKHFCFITGVEWRVGRFKDDAMDIKNNTLNAIDDMVNALGVQRTYVSGLMYPSVWKEVHDFIKRKNVNWIVQKE